MLKPQQMATITMVAAVISALILVLPLLGISLPSRVGAVAEWEPLTGCSMNIGDPIGDRILRQTTGNMGWYIDTAWQGRLIAHQASVCGVMEQNTAGLCEPIPELCTRDRDGYQFCIESEFTAGNVGNFGTSDTIRPSKACRMAPNAPEWWFQWKGNVGEIACGGYDHTLLGSSQGGTFVMEEQFCDDLKQNLITGLDPSYGPYECYESGQIPDFVREQWDSVNIGGPGKGFDPYKDNHMQEYMYSWNENNPNTVYCVRFDVETERGLLAEFVRGPISAVTATP